MNIGELSRSEIRQRARREGIALRIGPFTTLVRSSLFSVAEGIHLLYERYPAVDGVFADFHISIGPPSGVRRWLRPQVNFFFDGRVPFKPLPQQQAFALFEWGLNWCVANHAHQFLIVHAAVVEKNGLAALLPAPPGAGKSTLCAALVNRGWRLFSDELTLLPVVSPDRIVPVPRPVSLKNESIEVIRKFAPQACIGPVVRDTAKGTVAHMRAPVESVIRSEETATPSWIIFPKFVKSSATMLEKRPKAESFMEIATQSFNYSILGARAFQMLKQVISNSSCWDLVYSELDEAIRTFDALADGQAETSAA